MSMVQSVLWLTAANLAIRAVSMLFQVYLSGQVGAAGLGLLQLILTVNAFAMTVGSSGIRVASMYLSAEEYGRRRFAGIRSAMAWCICCCLVLSSAVGAVLFFSADFFALHWVKDLRAAAALRLLGLTLPIHCTSSVLCGYFTACGKVRRLAAVEILDRVASVLLTAMLLQKGSADDLSHACTSIVAGGAVSCLGACGILFLWMCRDLQRYERPKEPSGMGGRLLRFCVPVALNDYLRSGLGTLEQFLIPLGLAKYGGSRNSAMADYGVIQAMVFPVLMFLSTVLYSVADLLVPRLARCRAEGNRQRLQAITTRCLEASCLFASAVAGLIFVLAKPLGLLLYDSTAAGRYLLLFSPLLPILYLDCIVDGMHKGLGQQIYCVRVNTLTNLLDVTGLFLLLPRWGVGGYFFTYAFTHVLNFFLSFHRLMKITDITPDLSFLSHTLLQTCLAAAVASFLPQNISWSCVCLRSVVYLAVFWLMHECFTNRQKRT